MGLEQSAWQQQYTVNNNMERLVATMQAVEHACAALQVIIIDAYHYSFPPTINTSSRVCFCNKLLMLLQFCM